MINRLLLILIMAATLQGCVFVAGAAAGAAGVAVVYDHRKLNAVMQDEKTANQISDKINANDNLSDNTHINVTCFNNTILLTGEATTEAARQQVESIARSVANGQVYNQITIQGPTSSLSRTSDTWITTKIKTQMLATKGLQSGTIKVVTENGSVYLMGMVTHSQADTAVNIARQVSGVQRVMKIFQYKD